MIVDRADRYPVSMADIGVRPLRVSSRIRSNTSTLASTAMPSVNTIPAIPGSVSVAWNKDKTASNNNRLMIKAPSA